ncbi:hypothetical protein [Nocardiopsis alba]|uniref:hypothetical protein n=1 Tax=Nocardiopsis alba TaxID=53437 RepID=UPI003400C75B
MSETTTREETKREKPAKRGLHGWKAALAVFGCGTLAAFAVFGVIVGLLSMLVNAASTGLTSKPDDQTIAGAPPAQPREELDPGGMDLCEDYLPKISDIKIEETIQSSHSDDALEGSYDPSSQRVVSGQCSFSVSPQYGVTSLWYFDFSFDAVIYDPSSDRDQVASEEFASKVSSASEYFEEVEDQSVHEWAGEARSFYGVDRSGNSSYLVVAMTRSATYQVAFKGDSDGVESGEVPELDFERQARDLVKRLDSRIFRVIPS